VKVSKPQSTEKCIQPVFRHWALKPAVRTSGTLWCHNKAVIALSQAPSPAHLDPPSNSAGFSFSECLPEICYIFYWITQKTVSQSEERLSAYLLIGWLTCCDMSSREKPERGDVRVHSDGFWFLKPQIYLLTDINTSDKTLESVKYGTFNLPDGWSVKTRNKLNQSKPQSGQRNVSVSN